MSGNASLVTCQMATLLKGCLVHKMWLYLSKTHFPKKGSLCPFWKHALIRPLIDTSGSLIYREGQDENAISGCSDASILFWELWVSLQVTKRESVIRKRNTRRGDGIGVWKERKMAEERVLIKGIIENRWWANSRNLAAFRIFTLVELSNWVTA